MEFRAVMNADGKTETIYKDGAIYISKAKAGRWLYFSQITKEWPEYYHLNPLKEIGKHASEKAAVNFSGTSSEGRVITNREVFKVAR